MVYDILVQYELITLMTQSGALPLVCSTQEFQMYRCAFTQTVAFFEICDFDEISHCFVNEPGRLN